MATYDARPLCCNYPVRPLGLSYLGDESARCDRCGSYWVRADLARARDGIRPGTEEAQRYDWRCV